MYLDAKALEKEDKRAEENYCSTCRSPKNFSVLAEALWNQIQVSWQQVCFLHFFPQTCLKQFVDQHVITMQDPPLQDGKQAEDHKNLS